jgi:HlyD family secretion protein
MSQPSPGADQLSNELGKLRIDKSRRNPGRRGRGWIWFLLALLLGIGAIVGVQQYKAGASVTLVETVRPRMESTPDSAVLVANGYIIAHHKIQVGSKIAGRVAWIGVEKGDRVAKGQVIVRLEDREYRAQFDQAIASFETAKSRVAELEAGSRPEEIDRAMADIQRAEAQVRTDEANYRRVENLVREGVSAAQVLDEARGRFDTSRATLASLKHTYELVRQGPRREQIDGARADMQRAKAAADYARTILDSTEIHVPIAGTILERNVEQGEMVTTSFVGDRGAKSFVVTLADLNDVQVELDISQNDFNRVGPNQPCTLVTDSFPDRPYNCRVDEIAPEANRQKGTVQVKVKIQQPDNYIRPEMNARVTFLNEAAPNKEAAASEKLWIVPKGAIVDRASDKAVMTLSGGVVQSKPITIAREAGSDVYVSAGLTGNETIIVGNALTTLKVGDRAAPHAGGVRGK